MTLFEQRPASRNMTYQRGPGNNPKDYTKCDICGADLDTDRMHVMVDNGYLIRNVFACRRHRYVEVEAYGKTFIQERTDRELEHLANQFRQGLLPAGWE